MITPIEIHEDTPYIQVAVNDSDPLWFNLDSGASACVIDTAVCRDLQISTEGIFQATGAGAGSVEYSNAKDVRYTVAGEVFTAEQSYAIDLSGISTPPNRKLAGLLGYDFFKRFVIVIDYEKSVMNLLHPETYDYRGKGEELPLSFRKKVPFVKGKILVFGQAITEREWLVDSGSSDALNDDLLADSTAEKNKTMGGRGLGSEFETWHAFADSVQLGTFSFKNVSGYSGGMKIGGGLLRHFTVIFDYPRQRMILEPNSRYIQ